MNKKKLVAASLFLIGIALFISSCKKETSSEPLEPISVVSPDSSIIYRAEGADVAIEIKFTTDRPINWVKGMYDIDSSDLTGHVATYPDTLFFQKLDTLEPRQNLYTYSGTYHIPDTLNPYDIIRFKVSFEAGNSSFITGQNYPAGIVGATKEFRIDIR